jgi:ketosteroid isomerase-like protein
MSHQQNIAIAQDLLAGIGGGRDPAEIAAMFDADLVFEIQGDAGALPWIGRKTGRQAIADFIGDIRTLTEPVSFDVEDSHDETRSAGRSLVPNPCRKSVSDLRSLRTSWFRLLALEGWGSRWIGRRR